MKILKILINGINKTDLKKEFFYVISISLFAAVLELLGLGAFSYLMATIFAEGEANNNILSKIISLNELMPNQNFVIITFVILFTLNIFTSFFSNYLIQKIISKKYLHFRTYVFNEYIKKDFKEIANIPTNELINKINIDPGKFLTTGFGSFCIILKNLIIISIVFAYLVYFNFYTIYILIFCVIIFSILFTPQINKIFSKISTLERSYNVDTFLSPGNIIQNFKEIKLFFAESFFAKKFYESSNKLYRSQLKLIILRNLPKLLIEFCLIIIITIFFINFSQTSSKDETFIFFATLVFALIRIIPYIVQITRNYLEILGAQVYIINFLKQDYPKIYLDKRIVKEAISKNESRQNKKFEDDFEIKDIKLKNINFKFKDKIVFEDLNLDINKGEKILIYGDSGEGKSVLLEIICGFRDNFSGEVLINGKKIDNETLNSLKTKIGLISQNISFINAPLIENVAFGKKADEIDIEKAKESLMFGGLKEFCDNSKLFDFKINPNFKNISEGQAKRLALARLFYFNKKIVLLDETTANLDKKLEKEILNDLLKNQDLTLILVTHDPNLREIFEKVYKVENKKVLEIKR